MELLDKGSSERRIRVSYADTHKAVVRACSEVVRDNYLPNVLIGISTGGLLVLRIAKACLEQDFNVKLPAYVMGISYYDDENKKLPEPVITQKLDSGLERKINGLNVLMFDEVNDSGRTLETASRYILGLGAKELRILVAYVKDAPKTGNLPESVKLYYGEKIPNVWIEYPWESKEFF